VKTLVILGMHRSGTSLIAQSCTKVGISPGPESGLLSAQADNPEGFYENRNLVEINEQMLLDSGGSWYCPPVDSSLEPGSVLNKQLELKNSLDLATGGQFFLKDPRLCITWPHWLPLLDAPTVLFVYRSPLAVARSLQRRNGFPLQLGLLIWEVYTRNALRALEDYDALAFSYDRLADGKQRLSDLFQKLADWGFVCEPAHADAIYSPELRHFQSAPSDEADSLLTSSQRELHEYCNALCAGSPLPSLQPSVDTDLHTRLCDFSAVLTPLARVVETTNERDDALALTAERTSERDRALQTLDQLESDHGALVSAHEQELLLHRQTADTLSTLQSEHRALANAHETEVGAHKELQCDHRNLIDLHNDLHVQLDEHAVKIDDLGTDISELQNKADYLFYSLTESFNTLLEFELSFMARLQRYTRKVYRFLSLRRGRNSAYEDLLGRAHEHFAEFELSLPKRAPGKLSMAGDVLRYVRENPAGSARSFSWTRLRRAASVFFGSSSEDLAVWVNARFPSTLNLDAAHGVASLGADLDDLELEFAEHESPRVSIIVPVYNDYRVTVNCLRSIHENTTGIPYEIIIGDDCSTDLTTSLLERIRGVRVSRTAENLRFLGNCNLAAEQARGDILVFLNNDTAVTEGWLDTLVAPFETSDVGVTGPKLLFPDGRLQEAGGIIWRDASGWNFGRADDAQKPAYNYLRETDYVSGACLAIRHNLWKTLQGFDTRFAPAYYEDADLCFAAREAGYRVLYQPKSVVFHFEGVSNGTDLNSGVKQYQVTNQSVFREKWAAELDMKHFANAQHVIHARDRSTRKPSVLVIDHYVPHYDKDAGGRSTQMYIELLLRLGCRVQFMGANFFPHEPYTSLLQAMGVEVLVGESIARHLDSWLAEHAPYIDEVMLHRPHVAEQFLPHLESMKPKPPISYFGHDLHFLRLQREAALKGDESLEREAKRWLKRELAVFSRVDKIYYFSSAELEAIEDKVPRDKLRCIPLYAMDLNSLPTYAPTEPGHFLFVGGYNHPPNVDAALWLAEEILPAVREQVTDAHLHIVGSNPPPDVTRLAGDHVTVHGFVSDERLTELYRSVGAAVVPLQYGAGVKGKVIEAIAHHVPLVTTDIGAEGIPEAERVMWIENSPAGIAQQLAEILSNIELTKEKLDQHESWLQSHFDADRAAQLLQVDRPALLTQ